MLPIPFYDLVGQWILTYHRNCPRKRLGVKVNHLHPALVVEFEEIPLDKR